MNVEALRKRITEFGFKLLDSGFALDARQHKVEKLSRTAKSLEWVRFGNTVMIGSPARVSDYISLLEHQDYSYLMKDGGVVQIAYSFSGSTITAHRLCYYPCPFDVAERDLQLFEGGILDFIRDVFVDAFDESILLRSPVRFDYAPHAAKDFHPASHVTINDPTCRIPVRSPLNFDTFIKFVLENFYLDAWISLKSALSFQQEGSCLSAHDASRAYLIWAYQ